MRTCVCDALCLSGVLINSIIDKKVLVQLQRALQPSLTDIKIEWCGVDNVIQSPYHILPVFAGSKIAVFGFLPKDQQCMFSAVY